MDWNFGDMFSGWSMPSMDTALQVGSIGLGGAGTVMGILDAIQARKAAEARNRQFQQLRSGGITPFIPNQTPEQMQQYLRPYSAQLAVSGHDPTGGAWRASIADALNKNFAERYQMGTQGYDRSLAALTGQQPMQAMGDMGGLGKALGYAMMARAMKRPQSQPGQAMTTNMPGLNYQGDQTPWQQWANPSWAQQFQEFPQYDASAGNAGSGIEYGPRWEPSF